MHFSHTSDVSANEKLIPLYLLRFLASTVSAWSSLLEYICTGSLHSFLEEKNLKLRFSLGRLPENLWLLNKQPFDPIWHLGLIQWSSSVSSGASVHIKLATQNEVSEAI